jgi:hypothetical protein
MKKYIKPDPPKTKPNFYIGIDPGVNTGFAVYNRAAKKLTVVETRTILTSFEFIETIIFIHGKESLCIVFEDARKRYISKDLALDNGRLQGAGSVKRDSQIWQEFCQLRGIYYQNPKPNGKINALVTCKPAAKAVDNFTRLTGWQGQTSEHSRVAAMLAKIHGE